MKILFLTAHLPYPPASGGRRREFELVKRLGEKFERHLCSLTVSPEIDNIYTKYLRPYCRSISTAKVADSTSYLEKYSIRNSYPFLMRKYYSEEGRKDFLVLQNIHAMNAIDDPHGTG